MSELTCPKCHGPMRTYERSSVTVDQCTECRGIFLDRGELERLVDAEAAWNEGGPASTSPAGPGQHVPPPPPASPPPAPAPPPAPGYQQQSGYGQPHYEQPRYDQHGYGYGKQHKRRKSFFEELFD